jgi:hypothetical protein
MNYAQGFFRLWIAASVIWIAAAGSVFVKQYGRCCKTPFDPSQPYQAVVGLPDAPWVSIYQHDLMVSGLYVVGVPLALLAAGLVVVWIGRGFRT